MVCWLPVPKSWHSPSGPGEWLEGMKGQMEPERTETFWCVVSDRASGWCVWCLWAGLSLAGQTVKLRVHTCNTVKYMFYQSKSQHIKTHIFKSGFFCKSLSPYIMKSTDGLKLSEGRGAWNGPAFSVQNPQTVLPNVRFNSKDLKLQCEWFSGISQPTEHPSPWKWKDLSRVGVCFVFSGLL